MARISSPTFQSRPLTFEDAIEVHRLKDAGYIQSKIAAIFDTNQGRISEILNGARQPGSREAYEQRHKPPANLGRGQQPAA